uniref:Uncharacterized protein n=1 Tax=Strigamia maritima TaxID=126957 RepID=T1IZF9_STRMM
MEGLCKWIQCSAGEMPANAVVGGQDGDATLYVGRAAMFGDVIPGKIFPECQACFVSWGGDEHQSSEYEALVGEENAVFEWVETSGGQIPENAVEGGVTQEGEKLYIGKAVHENAMTCGKVHPSHGVLYIPYGGLEVPHENYEILVCKPQ